MSVSTLCCCQTAVFTLILSCNVDVVVFFFFQQWPDLSYEFFLKNSIRAFKNAGYFFMQCVYLSFEFPLFELQYLEATNDSRKISMNHLLTKKQIILTSRKMQGWLKNPRMQQTLSTNLKRPLQAIRRT